MSEKDPRENVSEHDIKLDTSQLQKMLNESAEPSKIVRASRSFEDLSLFLKRKEDEDYYD